MDALCFRFGRAVRRHREDRGWSQEALAGRADINRSYLGEVERAAVMPSLATAAKLAVALEVPLALLIAESERPPIDLRPLLAPHRPNAAPAEGPIGGDSRLNRLG